MTPIIETLLTGILYFPIFIVPILLLLGYAIRDAQQEEMDSPPAREEAQQFISHPWRKQQTALKRIQVRKVTPVQRRKRQISAYLH